MNSISYTVFLVFLLQSTETLRILRTESTVEFDNDKANHYTTLVNSTERFEIPGSENQYRSPMLKPNEIPNLPRFEPRNAFLKNRLDQTELPIVSSYSSVKPIEENPNNDVSESFRNSSFYDDVCQYCPEMRYLQHYFAKGCIALEFRDICKPKFCPKYFICPEEKELPKDGCRYNKTLYSFGESVPHSDPCQHCVCINSTTGPMLSCAVNECFNSWTKIGPNCYRKYIDGECCPEIVCVDEEKTLPTCEFEGNVYNLGDYFSPRDDPCYNCVCDEKWNSTKTPLETQCRQIECTFDQERPEFKGCAPVYSDKSCCPIYYHCPEDAIHKDEPKCYFGNKSYEIGEKIKVKPREVCLECTCLVPPEVTCKHWSCATAPENCTSVYIEGECCPQIHCRDSSEPPFPPRKSSKPKFHANWFYVVPEVANKTNPEDEWAVKCPPVDVCKYPCKLFLDGVHIKGDDYDTSNLNIADHRCPECRCDFSEEEPGKRNETDIEDSSSERISTFSLNATQPDRLGKFEKVLVEPDGRRCPAIACEYPCYIYRVNENECPKCSCSSNKKFTPSNKIKIDTH